MPYCDTCDKYHTPSALDADGHCPSCGANVGLDPATPVVDEGEQPDRVPWHFKLLVGILVGYLGFRIIQMISWLF